MKIELTSLSDADLAVLIAEAMSEWGARQPTQTVIERRKPPVWQHVVAVDEPPEDEKDFMLRVKTRLLRGDLILAADRGEFKQIAAQYPAWVKQQGLPTDPGGSTGRNWRERYARWPPARER